MVLLKNREIAENQWNFVPDEETIPLQGNIIVTLQRWIDEKERLQAHNGQVGVQLDGADDPYELSKDVLTAPLIALTFPRFADGRNYSTARILRENLGYKGILRARGDVLRDQVFYMWRVGIDEQELADGVPTESALKAFKDFSVVYQPGADEPNPIFRR